MLQSCLQSCFQQIYNCSFRGVFEHGSTNNNNVQVLYMQKQISVVIYDKNPDNKGLTGFQLNFSL